MQERRKRISEAAEAGILAPYPWEGTEGRSLVGEMDPQSPSRAPTEEAKSGALVWSKQSWSASTEGLKTWAQALVPHPPRASPPGDTRPCTARGGGLHGAGGRSGSSSQGKSSDGAAMEWQERSQQSGRPWTKSEEPSGAQGRWRSRSCDREGGRVLPPTSKGALLSGRLRLCLGKQQAFPSRGMTRTK